MEWRYALIVGLFVPSVSDADDNVELRMRMPKLDDKKIHWQLVPRDPFTLHIAPDGTFGFDDHVATDVGVGLELPLPPSTFGPFDPSGNVDRTTPPLSAPMLSMGFRFDLTDILMRRRGEDPYRAEKRKALARTFETRLATARREQRRLVWRALRELPMELERLWADPTKSPTTKRAELDRLWLEADSDERGRDGKTAGAEARAIIEQFRAAHP